jgi:hypothetical protein
MEQIFNDKKIEKEGQRVKMEGGEENKIKGFMVKCLINNIYGNVCIYGRVVEILYNTRVMLLK